MNKIDIKGFAKNVEKTIAKYSPEILTGIGITGMLTSTILAVKATPKAIRIIQNAEKEKELDTKEKIKLCWKLYIPAAITGLSGAGCVIGASSVNFKRNAALATAYSISEAAVKEYKEKVVETLGEKKEQVIHDKIAKDKVNEMPASQNEVIVTGSGTTLCLDAVSGRYFMSDMQTIKKTINELNREMMLDDFVSLNEFYDGIGLSHTELGSDLGWNVDGGLIDVRFSSQITDDDRPCLVLNFSVQPDKNYHKFS